jgi:predicted MFS family arabinose efflux permease
MGIYGGVFVGFLVGAFVAEYYGWRAAFFVVGAPGLVVALIVKFTLREPVRGLIDGQTEHPPAAPLGQVLRQLGGKRTFQHLSLAAALHAFVGYGVNGFHPSFLIRTHGFSVAEVGVILSIVSAVSGLGGTWLGGYLADRFTNWFRDVRWQLWVPGVATLINVPLALMAYTWPDRGIVVALLFASLVFGVMYLGPTFATVQRLVTSRERALGAALLLLVINLIGLGLGPWLVGMVSDVIYQAQLGGGASEPAAKAQGLQTALAIMVCINVWSFAHYMLAARSLERDSIR